MAKFIFVLLALVAVTAAKPIGGIGVGHHSSSHVSHHSHYVVPYWGLGYGMLGYPGIIGHSISSHSSHSIGHHHGIGHMGYGMGMMKGIGIGGYYPGGIGIGYGLMG